MNYYLHKKKEDIVPKIYLIVSSPKSVYVKILKCLTNLFVMKVLPPPGGPIAVKRIISSNFIN